MNRAVIVCGVNIKDYEFVSSFFAEGDFFIYCDSGYVVELAKLNFRCHMPQNAL